MNLSDIIFIVAATLNALSAGLFFAWSVSVMPGLARVSDREFVAAMRAMNVAIQNLIFFTVFFGAPLFTVISTVLHYGESARFSLLLAASFVHITGVFAVTVFGNVPLNNRLERLDVKLAADDEIKSARANFERRWNILNHFRAFSATLAFVLIALACLK